VLASYLGHFKLAASYRLRQSLWRRYPFLAQFFELAAATGRLRRKDKAPLGLKGVARQYRYFRRRFLGDVLFFQVGRFIEFYQPGDILLADELGLRPIGENRRGARFGFPLAHMRRHLARLLANGRAVTLIGETGRYLDGVEERAARARFAPVAHTPSEARVEARCWLC